MTKYSSMEPRRKVMITVGVSLMLVAVFFFVVMGIWLVTQGKFWGRGVATDAVVFVDVPGRISIDGTLQADGPAPIPVSAGVHMLALLDTSWTQVLTVTVGHGEFKYVPNPSSQSAGSVNSMSGAIHATAFPPDTIIEVSGCNRLDSVYATICRREHTLDALIVPGTFNVHYANAQFGNYEEVVTVTGGSSVKFSHSFITTVDQWHAWLRQHGDLIEQN